jgi:ribonuclease P protein component
MTAATLRRLTKRSQFTNADRGRRAGRAAFTMRAIPVEDDTPGLGLTVSKKTGNAPERNRIKRRLRAAARSCADAFQPRHDYVLIARRDALGIPFTALVEDIRIVLNRVHAHADTGTRAV